MEVSILGSSGSEAPGLNPPAFLIDDFLLLDAGTVALTLDKMAQCRLTHVFLTHAHLDHLKGVPFLLDNLNAVNPTCRILVLSGKEVISDIRKHIFNNRIWPDFTTIPEAENPIMRYQVISTRKPVVIGDYTILATRVNHSVQNGGPAVERHRADHMLSRSPAGAKCGTWKGPASMPAW